jgi:protein disulfide-isomerase A1
VKNLRFPLNEPRAPLEDELEGFVQNFLDGNLQPTIKSEPVPENNECPLVDVVALNYQDIVMDEEKDVFLEFCIEPCYACEMLLPTLEKLARLYGSNTKLKSQVTIGKINVDANDIPDREIQGFPTIKLYPAGSKDAPVFYSGTRTLKDMADFIRDHGKHRAEVPGIEEEQVLEDEMTCSLDCKECAATNGPNEESEQAGVLKGSSVVQGETKPSGRDEL